MQSVPEHLVGFSYAGGGTGGHLCSSLVLCLSWAVVSRGLALDGSCLAVIKNKQAANSLQIQGLSIKASPWLSLLCPGGRKRARKGQLVLILTVMR